MSKFSTPHGVKSVLVTFYKNHFPPTFGGHLEFLCKTLKELISVRDRAILTKIFGPRIYAESTGDFVAKVAFLPLFNFEFLRKAQKCIHLGNGVR